MNQDIRNYWQDCRSTLKPKVVAVYDPLAEYGEAGLDFSLEELDAQTVPELPARVVLNDLANFMAARPSARVVPGAGGAWPMIRIDSEAKA